MRVENKPTIVLERKDTEKLLNALKELRDFRDNLVTIANVSTLTISTEEIFFLAENVYDEYIDDRHDDSIEDFFSSLGYQVIIDY